MDVEKFYDGLWSSDPEADKDRELQRMRSEAIGFSYQLIPTDKKILEVGCGAGFQTMQLAGIGNSVVAIDFSEQSVRRTGEALKIHRIDNVKTMKCNAESMQFEDNIFDVIYINSVLMHVRHEKVLCECSRVLKKGGKVIIVEPLAYNFLLPYRLLFSDYQKTGPRYMTLGKFRKYQYFFSEMKHREFYFFSILLLPLFKQKGMISRLCVLVKSLDRYILSKCSFLRNFSWIAVVEYRK